MIGIPSMLWGKNLEGRLFMLGNLCLAHIFHLLPSAFPLLGFNSAEVVAHSLVEVIALVGASRQVRCASSGVGFGSSTAVVTLWTAGPIARRLILLQLV